MFMNFDLPNEAKSLDDFPVRTASTPSGVALRGSLPVVVKLLLEHPEGDETDNIALLGYN